MMTDHQEELILKFLQGNLSHKERESFELWLKEDTANQKLVADYEQLWKAGVNPAKPADVQTAEEWNKLFRAINETPVVHLNPRFTLLKVAATLILLLAASAVIYLTFIKKGTILHETAGTIERIELPDGSEVWLNEKSKLTYSDDFTDARNLELEGEGFFEVKRDPTKPFTIHTAGADVRVLGTSFNVRAYTDTDQTEVYVATGKVSLSTTDQQKTVILLPSTTGLFNRNNGTIEKDTSQHLNAVSWRDRRLVFHKTAMKEVVKTLKTYFKTDIRVNNEKLLSCRFTGTFDEPSLNEVLETIRLALDLRVTQNGANYSLDGEGCNPE